MLGGFARGRLRKRTCLRLFLASGPLGATCPGRGGPDPRRGSGAASMWRNVVIVIQRLMVRTQGGPLRPVWAALYTAVMHLVAAYLCYGHKGAAVYVCRSLAIDEPIYGVSDIDLVVVIPGAKDRNGTESERHRSRWRHLCRLVPPLRDLLPDVAFYEEAELREATRGPVLTGLDTRPSVSNSSPSPPEYGSHPLARRRYTVVGMSCVGHWFGCRTRRSRSVGHLSFMTTSVAAQARR